MQIHGFETPKTTFLFQGTLQTHLFTNKTKGEIEKSTYNDKKLKAVNRHGHKCKTFDTQSR